MDRAGRWPKINWNGSIYTKKAFLQHARNAISEHLYHRRRGDPPGVPPGMVKKNDVEGWIRVLGAQWILVNNVHL